MTSTSSCFPCGVRKLAGGQFDAQVSTKSLAFKIDNETPMFGAEFVGGKTRSIIRLVKAGAAVPDSFAVTVNCYREALNKLQEECGENVEDFISLEGGSVDKIRDALEARAGNYIGDLVREQLGEFLNKEKTYAVRSSANVEDGADSAFAGQFSTLLNVKGTEEDIINAIGQCWSSAFSDEIRPFLQQAGVIAEMGVLVMEQLDSEVAGVLFQANPISQSKRSWVINSTYGQGEGVVGGMMSVDEFVVGAKTKKVLRKNVDKKTGKMVLDRENGGLARVSIEDEATQNAASMNDEQLSTLIAKAAELQESFHGPQDIEFAFANGGNLYILQSRPITTMPKNWEAPEVGLWQLNGHATSPLTPIYQVAWCKGMSEGVMYNSELTGIGFVACDTTIINGFPYFCMRNPGPKKPPTALPPPFVLRMIMRLTAGKAIKQATNFWKNKVYISFMEKWDREIKPRLIEEHLALQRMDLASMSDAELSQHMEKLQEHGVHSYYGHSIYSMENLGPTGVFVYKTREFSNEKVSTADAFELLSGHGNVSEGLHGEFPEVMDLLNKTPEAMAVLNNESLGPEEALDGLKSAMTNESSFMDMLEHVECRLSSGYDICSKTIGECPDLLIAIIRGGVKNRVRQLDPQEIAKREADDAAKLKNVRQRIPETHLAEFDELLRDAKATHRLRDERAIYTDLWGMGVIRRGVLEAGRRIAAKSKFIHDPALLVNASVAEIQEMLKPDWKDDPVKFRELCAREQYRKTANVRNCPSFIGGVKLTPTRAHFPNEYLARTALSVIMAMDEIFESPNYEEEELQMLEEGGSSSSMVDSNSLKGLPSSIGEYTGRVSVVCDSSDLAKLEYGDVVITDYSSSLVNLVLPKCGALVTDFGGILSHAAICAREAQIPCVTGTKSATRKFKDGDIVIVSATKTVGIVKKKPSPEPLPLKMDEQPPQPVAP